MRISASLAPLYLVYGSFLLLCGITAVSFIGMKAKTALISGGTSAVLAFLTSWLYWQQQSVAIYLGLILCSGLLVVFSWRSTKTLFTLIQYIQQQHEEARGKAIAFLIISLMAVMTLFTLASSIILLAA